jgi:taurine dioxygenase
VNFASDVARNAQDKIRDKVRDKIGNQAQASFVGSLFEVIPTEHALGAEVWNVDIRSFDDWAFATLMRALLKHQVLLVREQSLGEPDLARFRQRFGRARVLFTPRPTMFGATSSFSSLHAIYDALPPVLRKRIANLKIRHIADATVQPLVGIHPDTGRSMLHLGERGNAALVDMEPAASDDLLDELWEFAAEPAFAWRVICQPGDLVISDPRCTMHQRATPGATHLRLPQRSEIWSSMNVPA